MSIQSIALISMPWMISSMPSIQLAILDRLFRERNINCTRYELFVDFADEIGSAVYETVSSGSSLVPEWLFAKAALSDAEAHSLDGFLDHRKLYPAGGNNLSDHSLNCLALVARDFIETWAERLLADGHTVFAFSLTISQTWPSLALAKAIKQRNSAATVIFGGTSCAGPMGHALIESFPEVDIVVSSEAETAIDHLITVLRGAIRGQRIPGISYRNGGSITECLPPKLFSFESNCAPLDYDPYFDRLRARGVDPSSSWIPVESSRGCWYGVKSQCTFCGLHEIMSYRQRPVEEFVGELASYKSRYGGSNFFTVDLILPQSYQSSLPVEIRNKNLKLNLFYEIKANVTRPVLERLSSAGVTWVQPGIESLDDNLLRLMKKGVSAAQNVSLLRNSRELGVSLTWSLLTGVPGEDETSYRNMRSLIPSLYHLPPPSGCTTLEIHRFSPYFESPSEFGVTNIRPHPLYDHIFGDRNLLIDLVYLHEGDYDHVENDNHSKVSFNKAVSSWRRRYSEGASLNLRCDDDGGSFVIDGRGDTVEKINLTLAQIYILNCLRQPTPLVAVATKLEEIAFLLKSRGIDASPWQEYQELISNRFCVIVGDRVVSIVIDNSKEVDYGTGRCPEGSKEFYGPNAQG